MGNLIFLLYPLLAVLVMTLITMAIIWCINRNDEKERRQYLKRRVKSKYESVEQMAYAEGNGFSVTLLEFADKMDKISSNEELKEKVKPYDTFGAKSLCGVGRPYGEIIIDKGLNPKFIVACLIGRNNEEMDTELEAALDASGVRKLALECRKIRFDFGIEEHRKQKIEKSLNEIKSKNHECKD